MSEIVISYRREDAGDAGRLGEMLGLHFGPERVFLDTVQLRGGDRFPEAIEAAIRECKAVVAVIAANWSAGLGDEDDWVRREMREALAGGRPIVPVLLRGRPPLVAAELPADLVELAALEAVVVDDHDYRDDVARLIEGLERLGAAPAPRSAFPELAAQGRAEKRAVWDLRGPAESIRTRVERALADADLRIDGTAAEDTILVAGGTRLAFRLIGGLFASERRMPVAGRIRVRDHGAGGSVEVLLHENLGIGSFAGLGRLYESRLDKAIATLRQGVDAPGG